MDEEKSVEKIVEELGEVLKAHPKVKSYVILTLNNNESIDTLVKGTLIDMRMMIQAVEVTFLKGLAEATCNLETIPEEVFKNC